MKFLRTLPYLCGILSGWMTTSDAFACSVCFGNPQSAQTKAVWAGVALLLGVTGFVLGGIAFLAIKWALRAKEFFGAAGEE